MLDRDSEPFLLLLELDPPRSSSSYPPLLSLLEEDREDLLLELFFELLFESQDEPHFVVDLFLPPRDSRSSPTPAVLEEMNLPPPFLRIPSFSEWSLSILLRTSVTALISSSQILSLNAGFDSFSGQKHCSKRLIPLLTLMTFLLLV